MKLRALLYASPEQLRQCRADYQALVMSGNRCRLANESLGVSAHRTARCSVTGPRKEAFRAFSVASVFQSLTALDERRCRFCCTLVLHVCGISYTRLRENKQSPYSPVQLREIFSRRSIRSSSSECRMNLQRLKDSETATSGESPRIGFRSRPAMKRGTEYISDNS